jgi:hypothetical protein
MHGAGLFSVKLHFIIVYTIVPHYLKNTVLYDLPHIIKVWKVVDERHTCFQSSGGGSWWASVARAIPWPQHKTKSGAL